MTASPHRPWFREPMLWLVIGLPLSSIVAGLSLLGFALHTGGADTVTDEVQRMSQIQLSDLDADHRAQRRGLQAELAIDADTGAVRLTLLGATADDRRLPLQLDFVHPLRAGQDRRLALTPAGDAWLGRFDGGLGNDWQLQLRSDAERWRLEGRLQRGQALAQMAPRFAADAAGPVPEQQ
jgi:uncharacterized protein